MDECLIMKVRCPYCDRFLFETDSANMNYKCACHNDLMITVENGRMLITRAAAANTEDNYNELVGRQIAYIAKVSTLKNSHRQNKY